MSRDMPDLTEHINAIAESAHQMRNKQARTLIAVAGAPGSGKTTLARELSRRLTDQKCANAVVPLDGFHLDNRVLEKRGQLLVKGAPETFDVEGFSNIVARLRGSVEVIHPIFDRERDIAIGGAGVVPADTPVVIVEGNYLLFKEAPWNSLAKFWDLSVWLDVPEEDLRARLIHRWLKLNFTRAAAVNRAESNDMVNVRRVIDARLTADIDLRN